jgi:hypothetical protein
MIAEGAETQLTALHYASSDGRNVSLRVLVPVRSLGRFCVSKRMPLFLISGLLFLSILAVPRYAVSLHAAGFPGGPGLVCLMDPTSAPAPPINPCPGGPWNFTGPFPSTPQPVPTQIRIGVFINGSNALNGFDITLKSSDTSVLVPANFDVAGTVLGAGTTSAACINGIGVFCALTDGYGTLHLVLAHTGGAIVPAPVTGLLFNSFWNIVGNSGPSGASIGFQTGCVGTSVAPDVCVTISNGSFTPDFETIQTGNIFSNPLPLTVPWVALTSPNATTLAVVRGSTAHLVISAVAENGWPSLSNDVVAFSSLTSGLPLVAFSVPSCMTAGTSCNTNATLNTATAGVYIVYILGNYTTLDSTFVFTNTLIGLIRFEVNVQDVTISVSPPGSVYMFGTVALSVTVQSLTGYAGTVTLSTAIVSPATGITFSYPTPFSLGVNSAVTKTVTVTSTSFNRYLYQMRLSVAGVGCVPSCGAPTITHNSLTLAFVVSGFSLNFTTTGTPTTGNSPALTVSIKSLGKTPTTSFAGPVTISSTSTPPGLRVSFSATSITLTAGGSGSVLASFNSAASGTYTVHIMGTGGFNNQISNQTAGLFFNLTDTFAGVKGTISAAVSLYSTSGTLPGSTFLSAADATTGAPIYSKMAGITVNYNAHGMGHFIDDIPTSPYWLAMNCGVDVSLVSASCFMSRTPDIFHTGLVDINDYSLVNIQFGQMLGSPTYNPLADLEGTGTVNIIDISIEGLYFGCTVVTPSS